LFFKCSPWIPWLTVRDAEQFWSAESFGMGIFYTLNVFLMQFYLGTTRLQLEAKGDTNNAYSNFGNVVVAFAFLAIPLIGWLLDTKVRKLLDACSFSTLFRSIFRLSMYIYSLEARIVLKLYDSPLHAGLWHHAGHHQRPGSYHLDLAGAPCSADASAYSLYLDAGPLFHVLQVRQSWVLSSLYY
jgi:hypothetical protein